MSALLNAEESDLFYAYLRRSGGGPLLFMVNPNEVESVRLSGKVTRRIWSRRSELITQFPRAGRARVAEADRAAGAVRGLEDRKRRSVCRQISPPKRRSATSTCLSARCRMARPWR